MKIFTIVLYALLLTGCSGSLRCDGGVEYDARVEKPSS
jgi:PBP1b-binding outer membrane lipoprotein LpoB